MNDSRNRFEIVRRENLGEGYVLILRDCVTGVLYWSLQHLGVGLTPLIDAQGKPLTKL